MKTVRHHIIQRMHGGSNHKNNLHRRDEEFERAYHMIFPDMLPIDRINHIMSLDGTVYHPDAAQVLKDAIDEVRRAGAEAYDPICLKKKNVFV